MRSIELMIFVAFSLHLVRVDLAMHRLPNRYTGLLALCLSLVGLVGADFRNHLIGACVAFGALLFLHLVRSSALGLGDVKYAWSCGWLLADSAATLIALWLAFFLAAMANVTKLRSPSRLRIAFGPYLFVATLVLAGRHSVGALVEMASIVKE